MPEPASHWATWAACKMGGASECAPLRSSERFQERQQVIVRAESPEPSPDRSALCERLLFHGKVRVYVNICSLDALMSQPQRDHGDVDARLKQRHRRTMPNHVWRHSLLLQSGATGGCPLDCFPQQQMDSKSCQRLSASARECHRLL